jgi:hypothetical protein
VSYDKTKPIQFFLHRDTINIDAAFDVTRDMMAGVVRRIDGTMSTEDFEMRIPDVSVRINDQDNDDLFSQTAFISYYKYLNTNHSFFLEIAVYGKREFIGKIEKYRIDQIIENGFTYCEFNVPYLLQDLNNKIVNYIGTSIGDLEGLARFLVDNQSTQQEYEGEYYAISSAYIEVTFDRDDVEFDAIPSTGYLFIDTEIASYSATSDQGLDVNERMIVRFTFDTRELFNTVLSYSTLDEILVVSPYAYTDIITNVIADVKTDVVISGNSVTPSTCSLVSDIAHMNNIGNSLVQPRINAIGKYTELPHVNKAIRFDLEDFSTIEIEKDDDPETGTVVADSDWMRYLNYYNKEDNFNEVQYVVARDINLYFYDGPDTLGTITAASFGILNSTDAQNYALELICANSASYLIPEPAPIPYTAYDVVYTHAGLDNIYDFIPLSIYDAINGFQYAVIQKDSVTGYIMMNLYKNLPETTALTDLATWLASGTLSDSIVLSQTDNITSSGYRMYHGFVHGWGYTYDTDAGTIKKITYHDNRDIIGETIDGEIFEVAINMDSLTFDLSEEVYSYVYPQDYSPYLGIRASDGLVNKRKAVGYRNMYLVNVNTGTDEDKILKVRYLYDCIKYTIKNKKMLQVLNDYRKYYYAFMFLNRKNELVIRNIRALFDNVQNTTTLNTSFITKYKKMKWTYADVALIPDNSDISYAIRKFYENETLRIFGDAQNVWEVETSEYIDAFYFDYVSVGGAIGTVIGKEINFSNENDIKYMYTLIMQPTASLFDAFSVL